MVHLASHPSRHQARVVAWRRHHAKHLSRGRLDGNDTSYLALHQSLAERLQLQVDAEREVLAGNGLGVELAVLVAALYSAVCVAQQNMHSFGAAQLFLVVFLYAELSDIVACLVVVVVFNVGE